jgi:hypothetical protein
MPEKFNGNGVDVLKVSCSQLTGQSGAIFVSVVFRPSGKDLGL